MRRRAFIALAGSALAWPLAAWAEQRVSIVGVLIGVGEHPEGQARFGTLRQGLEALGWIEGQNLAIIVRFRDDTAKPLSAYAEELAVARPNVLVANTGPAVRAVLQADRSTTPIVFVQVPDPVGQGFIASLARPGGRLTGFSSLDQAMGGKWLELLKEVAPRLTTVSVLADPRGGALAAFLPSIEASAKGSNIGVRQHLAQDEPGIRRAIGAVAAEANHGLIVLPTTSASTYVELITALTTKHRIPAIFPYPYFAAAGGLISYGIDNLGLYVQAASYVDRILRGASPADLPVQTPTKFALTVNLKTAKEFGLTIPTALLATADEVIE